MGITLYTAATPNGWKISIALAEMELLYELLALSLKAPTSSNTQDWSYVVVTGREQKQRLAKLYLPLYRLFGPIERRSALRH